jgi:hypothetical protein
MVGLCVVRQVYWLEWCYESVTYLYDCFFICAHVCVCMYVCVCVCVYVCVCVCVCVSISIPLILPEHEISHC